MSRRRCCCKCPTVGDTFNRSDSTDLGLLWGEIAGDSDIYSNTLRQTALGDRAKFLQQPYPSWIATVTVVDPADGDIYNVLIDWQEDDADTTHYHYVQVEIDVAQNKCYLRLKTNDGGSHSTLELVNANGVTTLAETSIAADWLRPGATAWIHICLSSTTPGYTDSWEWSADFTTTEPVPGNTHLWTCVELFHVPSDSRIVLENGASQTIQWDDFEIMGHKAYLPSLCPDCICSCELHCIPRTLTATFVDIEGAPRLDGMTVTFRNRGVESDDYLIWVPDWWTGPPTVNDRLACSDSGEYGVIQWLRCHYGGAEPIFDFFSNWVACCESDAGDAVFVSAECDPIVITFEYDFLSEHPETGDCRGFSTSPEPSGSIRRHFLVVITE